MAEAINTSLELLPLPANGSGAPAVDAANQSPNLFLNQLLGALSKSSAELSLQAGQAVTEIQNLVPGLAQENSLPGKGLPLGGEDLPPAVEQALAVISGKSAIPPAADGEGELLPVHLFARSLNGSQGRAGEAAVQTGSSIDLEDQLPLDRMNDSKLGDELRTSEFLHSDSPTDTDVQIQEGGAAAVVAFSPQQLLNRRLSAADLGSDVRSPGTGSSLVPGQAQVLRESTEHLVQQAPTAPSATAGADSYNPLVSGLVQQPLAKLDSAGDFSNSLQPGTEKIMAELQTSIQSPGINTASSHVAATSALAREPLLTVPQHAFNDPQWAQAMGNRLTWMVHQGVHTATLQLVPENLGHIQVRVSMVGEMANIEFHARHAHTGDLIESMLPRLTAALDAQGVRVDEVKVHQGPVADNGNALAQNSQQSSADSGQARNTGYGQADFGLLDEGLQLPIPGQSEVLGLSLVDAYA